MRVDWVSPDKNGETSLLNRNIEVKTTIEKPRRIVEATGWIKNDKGEIIFTADAPVATSNNFIEKTKNCELGSRE